MFTTLIVQPIFNLLVLIYNLIPGHNFGLAIIIFTIVIRLLLWPLVKKQLHQTKLMRQLQPELKKVKAAAKGDRQKEALMMMELYKERGVRPLRSIGLILLQAPILIGLYLGLSRVLKDPYELINFSYPFIQEFSWMKELAADISKFDETLFGLMDLTRRAIDGGGIYWPALLMVAASAVVQYYQSRQLMPQDKDARSLRAIMKDAGAGKQADQAEVSAAVGRFTLFLLPAMIFVISVGLPAALSLYWLVGSLVAFIQQSIVLREDSEEMDKLADAAVPKNAKQRKAAAVDDQSPTDGAVLEGEVIETPPTAKKRKGKSHKAKKRRR